MGVALVNLDENVLVTPLWAIEPNNQGVETQGTAETFNEQSWFTPKVDHLLRAKDFLDAAEATKEKGFYKLCYLLNSYKYLVQSVHHIPHDLDPRKLARAAEGPYLPNSSTLLTDSFDKYIEHIVDNGVITAQQLVHSTKGAILEKNARDEWKKRKGTYKVFDYLYLAEKVMARVLEIENRPEEILIKQQLHQEIQTCLKASDPRIAGQGRRDTTERPVSLIKQLPEDFQIYLALNHSKLHPLPPNELHIH